MMTVAFCASARPFVSFITFPKKARIMFPRFFPARHVSTAERMSSLATTLCNARRCRPVLAYSLPGQQMLGQHALGDQQILSLRQH